MLVDHTLKTKKEHKNWKKQEIRNLLLKKACFQHEMTYGDFKDLLRRTASDEALRNLHLRNVFNVDLLPCFIIFL